MAPYMGKPWATISYHPSMEDNMGMNLVRGFAVDLVAVWLLVWLLLQFAETSLGKSVLASLAVGVIGYLIFPYTNSIWYDTPSLGYLIDAVVPFALIGAWLGWYLNRK